MANRYQSFSFTTASVNSAATLQASQVLGPHCYNLVKLKVVRNTGTGNINFRVFKKGAWGSANRLIRFENQAVPLLQPVDKTSGSPGVEALEGIPLPVDDEDGTNNDGTGKLHYELENLGTTSTFTISGEYEEVVVLSGAGDPTWRGKVTATELYLSSAAPRLQFYESDQAADEKLWDVIALSKVLTYRTRTDADGAGVTWLQVTRGTGTAVATIQIGSAATDLIWDNVNKRLGVGVASPSQALDVRAALAGVNVQSTTGTNAAFTSYANTSGFLYVGVDSSAGATLLAGSTGYAGIITNTGANPLQFGTNNIVRLTISSAGVATFSSTGQFVRLGLGAAADANHLVLVNSPSAGFGLKILDATGTSGVPVLNLSTTATSGGNIRNWMIGANYDVVGDFTIRESTAEGGDPYTAGATKLRINRGGSVILAPGGALATNATDGFTYIPTSAGAPTGTPATITGAVAMEYDTTNNKLYIYNGAWKSVTLT